jgi:hypothetical protein
MNGDRLKPRERDIIAGIEKGLAIQQPKLIRAAVLGIDEVLFDDVSPGFFGRIIDLVDSPQFVDAPGTDHLLYAFIGNWDDVGADDRERLLSVIEKAFPAMHDQMGCVFAAELLGNHFRNEEALAVLERLLLRSPARQRACIPHGLKLLVRKSSDQSIAKRARKLLHGLQSDESADVRAEAADALAELG